MRTVELQGQGRVHVVDAPTPRAEGRHVVVKVMASSICGAERTAYVSGVSAAARGGHTQQRP